MTILKNINPEVIRNVGIPIMVYQVMQARDGSFVRTETQVEVQIKFDNWRLHLIEERFGTVETCIRQLQTKPYSSIIGAIAIAMTWADRAAAEAIIAEELADYMSAVVLALYRAMGMDPKAVYQRYLEMMEDRAEEEREREAIVEAQKTPEETSDSPGPTSGPSGSKVEETPNSSGPTALLSSP